MVQGDGFSIKLIDFIIPADRHGSAEARVGAKLELEIDGKSRIITPWLTIKAKPGTQTEIPGTTAKISLDRILAEDRTIIVTLTGENGEANQIRMAKGEKAAVGGYMLKFQDWHFPAEEHSNSGMGAIIEVFHDGKTATVVPMYEVGPESGPQVDKIIEPVNVPEINAEFELLAIDPSSNMIELSVKSTMAAVSVSVKPFMKLVWCGSFIALLGGCLAMWRRMSESSKDKIADTDSISPRKSAKV
jgi:hypothetical protein